MNPDQAAEYGLYYSVGWEEETRPFITLHFIAWFDNERDAVRCQKRYLKAYWVGKAQHYPVVHYHKNTLYRV